MNIPTLVQAHELLDEAHSRNPGPWASHSRFVAEAARRIAERAGGMDWLAAEVLGLLHDIGRRAGVTGVRHVLDGYRYLSGLGYDDAARIAMTHSFPLLNIGEVFGEWDTTDDELRFVEAYLVSVQLDDYDRLIQLCDAIAMADGFVLMEKRMLDVALRYGTNAHTASKWRKKFEIKALFENRMGCSIYEVLPGVVENTFRWTRARDPECESS